MSRRLNPTPVVGLVAAVLITSAATFDTYPRQSGIDGLPQRREVSFGSGQGSLAAGRAVILWTFAIHDHRYWVGDAEARKSWRESLGRPPRLRFHPRWGIHIFGRFHQIGI
ncbi:MAG: hypothetical protein O7F70_00340 [Gemmatimonadetes bacterium]|nr:hypothetical protein [Gemmatimonadota bacterium]